ncbi:mannitol dehydrogenase family protein [Hoeflea sp.]|uniref:mannitol dehydrogenase family protein n=1 Tax=Hoeflea sp. TaxID=1940281 RepID=UPI003B51D910
MHRPMQDMPENGLNEGVLSQLPDTIERPRYDRAGLKPGIVHVGLGNFHRAHQAWYLHRLMQAGEAHDWAIVGAGVRPADSAMRARLLEQDCLTTLIELDPKGKSVEITGSMIDFLPVEDGNGALIRCISDPSIRIVSLTVTEGGYFIAPDGGLDLSHPEIRHDIANPDAPRTVFGAIVAGLETRRRSGQNPFTVQSCDNLKGNGDITRNAVVTLARQRDPALADWIDTRGAFPNSMVDCIVPATGPAELALAESFGIKDAAPVTHENFRQWVIEDKFCAGRPDWDRAGATFSGDVHAYEAMKIRMLNAGHQVLANAGEILGVETIAGCMADDDISALFERVQRREIAPLVEPTPEMNPLQYVELITLRFSNPEIHDTTRRVAFDGLSRHRGFVVPIIADALEGGHPVEGLALVEALWARMCAGNRENGDAISPNDPDWESLVAAANMARMKPLHWLEQGHIYGDLARIERFSSAFVEAFETVWRDGARAAIRAYVEAAGMR